jgi:hypothetical protein
VIDQPDVIAVETGGEFSAYKRADDRAQGSDVHLARFGSSASS